MKNIELTKDHKSKLLEMCNKLFPELNLEMYYDNDIADNWEEALKDNSCGNDAQVGYLISNWHKPNAKIIHWFEFCMTYLLDKLHPDNDKQSKDNWSMDLSDKDYVIFKIIVRKKHPVDYLYEEFKKL